MEQRSKEWFKARSGKFTASDISRLLGKESLKKTKDSISNMAFEKAVDVVFGHDPEPEFLPADMQRGIDLEPNAFRLFKEIKELEFTEVKECSFYQIDGNSGASPDGLVGNYSVLEIKCPRRGKFFKYVSNGYEEIDIKYIAQMQMQMLATNTESCFLFNYLVENNEEFHHTIEVKRDEEMINIIEDRIDIASDIRDEFIYKLTNNKQF